MLPLLLVTGVKQAGADSYRSDWNMSEYFPSCAPYGEYPINYVTCLPDNTAPSSTTSLVYGQLVFANGDPVENYQYEGAAGYADLGINGVNPYGGDDVTEETPVWDGYFAFILPKDDDDPIDSYSVGGADEGWIFQSSDDGLSTPFGGDGHPTDQSDWDAPVNDVPVNYGSSTNLGTIVLPSPPDVQASCSPDLDSPAGSVTCQAQDDSGTGQDPQYNWEFDPSDSSDDQAGDDVSYTFPEGDGDYSFPLEADAGNGWTEIINVNADTTPCFGTCLNVNTSIDAPTNPDDGYQHVSQGDPVTVTSTVINEGDEPENDVTPGPLEGSPNTIVDGPEPASIDQLDPGASATFTWTATFDDADSDGSNSSVSTSATGTIGQRDDDSATSGYDSEADFVVDPSPLLVNVTGPSTAPAVGDLVPFNVSVTNQSGLDLTDVGPTSATTVPNQVDQQGNPESATFDFSQSDSNPNPIPVTSDLAAGATADYTVYGIADTSGTATIDVPVSGTDPSSNVDSSFGETDVTVGEQQPQPPAGFTLSTDPAEPVVGQPFSINATITNNSPDQTGTEQLNVVNVGGADISPSTGLSGTGEGSSGFSIAPGSSIQVGVYSGTATAEGIHSVVAYLQSSYATDTSTTSTSATTSFTVGDGLEPQSITFDDPLNTVTIGDPAQTVDPTASSGLPVTVVSGSPSVCTVTGSGPFTITPISGGTCVLSAQQAGDGVSWDPAPSVTRSFTANEVAQSITFNQTPTETITDTGDTATATATSGLPVTFSGGNSVCGVEPGGGLVFYYYGTCTIEANQAGDNTYSAAPTATESFTVLPSPDAQTQAITMATAKGMTYGQEPQVIAASAPGGYLSVTTSGTSECTAYYTGSDIDVTTARQAGTCTITVNQPGDGKTYLAAPTVSQTINFDPATLTLTGPTFFAHAGDTFDNWPVTYSGFVYNDGPGHVGGYESCTGPWTTSGYTQTITGSPGTYPTDCSGFTASGYQLAYDPGTVTILAEGTPEPPTAVTAAAGADQASVSWTAPNDAVDTYTVTASPGGATCTTASASGCTVPGLTSGTEYTFAVTSTTAGVTGPASLPSNKVLVTGSSPGSGETTTGGYGYPTYEVSVGTGSGTVYGIVNGVGGTYDSETGAAGTGTLTVAPFTSDPVGGLGTDGSFFDASLTSGAQYDDIELDVCDSLAGQRLEWWNPTAQAYQAVSPGPGSGTSYWDSSPCDVYTLTSTSTPSIDQLEGTVFALVSSSGSAPTSVGMTGPATAVAGSSYSATATAVGAVPAATYVLASGAPTWLSVDPTTGAVSGTVPPGTTSFTYSVTASNGDGSVTSPPQTVAVQAPVPVVTGLSASLGPIAGGNTITIYGSGFTGATKVGFGPANSTHFTVVNDTTITALVPAQAAATHNVVVTTAGGTSADVAVDLYTYLPPAPVVTGLSTSSGPTTGTNTVTITGTGFTGATEVAFGPVNSADFTVVNATTITAVAPPEPAATHNVAVTGPGGTSAVVAADRYTYVVPAPVPAITGLSTSTGLTTGGNTVTITGSAFTGATKVAFGPVSATGFTVVDDTTITAQVPAQAAGTNNVTVTGPGGTSAVVATDRYTYVVPAPVPAITGLSATMGLTTGGTPSPSTGPGSPGPPRWASAQPTPPTSRWSTIRRSPLWSRPSRPPPTTWR